MQAAKASDHQGHDEVNARPVGEPAVLGYETTSFVTAQQPVPQPGCLPEPIGAGRFQAPATPSSPQATSFRRSLPRPSSKRVLNEI